METCEQGKLFVYFYVIYTLYVHTFIHTFEYNKY